VTEPTDAASELSQMFDAAVEAYRLFGAFRVGGFSEEQALKMTAYVITAREQTEP
jgi:hypothetical protein